MATSTTSSSYVSADGTPMNPPTQSTSQIGRRASGAQKMIKNFSRRFQNAREDRQANKPLDINSLPQTTAVPVNGSVNHNSDNYDPSAQRDSLGTTSTSNTSGVYATPDTHASSDPHPNYRGSTDSSTSSLQPQLRPPQPSRVQSRIFASSKDFKLPELPWLCGTWYITHSTLPMWRDKRNVRITYTRLAGDKLDDLVTFQQLPGTESPADVGNAGPQDAPTSSGVNVPVPTHSPPQSSSGLGSGAGSPPTSTNTNTNTNTSNSGKRRSFNIRNLASDPKSLTTEAGLTALASDAKNLGSAAAEYGTQQYARAEKGVKEFDKRDIGVKSQGAGDGTDRYKGAVGELKQVRGTDTVMKDGSYVWRGKGFGLLKTGTWEVLGWGGGGKPRHGDVVQNDTTADQWMITYFGATMTSPAGISICSRRKTGLSPRMYQKLYQGLQRIEEQLMSERGTHGLGDSMVGKVIKGRGDFGRLVDGLFEVVRD